MRDKKKKKDITWDEIVGNTREVNEKVEKKAKNLRIEFKKFVAKGSIVDLAVAVVVGSAFNGVVNSLVSNIITPLTSLILPRGDLSSLKWVLTEGTEADEEAGIEAVGEVAVCYGAFLEKLIDFLIIALSIFFVMRVFLRLKQAFRRREIEEAERRAKEEAARKKAEADAEAERLEKVRNDFIKDVADQASALNDIREIMLRLEEKAGTKI